MISTTAVLWGLLGALFIGASDCIARVTAQTINSNVLFLFIMGCSSMVLVGGQSMFGSLPPFHAYAWLVSALSGALTLIALYFLYLALARGPVSVASPAASTFVVMLVAINIFAGESWSVAHLLAIALVFFGVSQLARHSPDAVEDHGYDAAWLRRTAVYALLAAIAVTVRMFMAQEAGDVLGAMHALTLNRVFALLSAVIVLIWQLSRKVSIVAPRGRMLGLVLLQALFETLAIGAFLTGSATAGRIGTTIGFSAFAVTTVLIARIWLGEKIGKRRSIWMMVVLAGLVLGSYAA